MYALSMFFLIAGLASLLMIAVSLLTPKGAVFFKNKTRAKGAFLWFIIGFICLMMIGYLNDIQFPPEESARMPGPLTDL